MNDAPLNGLRRIIPRWRESQITLASRELATSRPGKLIGGEKSYIIFKQQLWNEQRQIEYAADLVASALSQGYSNEAIEAAEYLISESQSTTPTVVLVAQDLLRRAGKLPYNEDDYLPSSFIDRPKIFERIHSLRVMLSEYPHNALLWSDLSKAYVSLGQLEQSKSAMFKALVLSPDNRFILRSAARLFIHLDEPDHAHQILINRPITSQDPWLIASEIATATVAGKTPKLVRLGKYMLERGEYPPFHFAELASALATLELNNGSHRKARKLFQISLTDPNDNSVAQSTWARRWLPSLEIEAALTNTPRIYEANALNAILNLNWHKLVDATQNWLFDEPFSSRPAELGSFAASVGLEDFPLAIVICKNGLIANPYDHSLINNLAFALANQGNLQEARKLLKSVSLPIPNEHVEITLKATEGLINFREGNIEAGQALYLEAISIAERTAIHKYKALASIYYAREMLLSGGFTKSIAITFAEAACGSAPEPDVLWVFNQLKEAPAQKL